MTDLKTEAVRFNGLWGKAPLTILDEMTSENFQVHYPVLGPPIKGKAAYREVLASFRKAFPDADITALDCIAENNKVVVKWSLKATHEGPFLGFEASGKRVAWTGITLYEFQGNKVSCEIGEEDASGLLTQIGVQLSQ